MDYIILTILLIHFAILQFHKELKNNLYYANCNTINYKPYSFKVKVISKTVSLVMFTIIY